MEYKKGKYRFLPFLLALVMVCASASIASPVTVYAEDDGQEVPNAEEVVGTLEARDALAMSPYVSGQGGTMQIAMLDPAPSDIQTAGMVTAQEAGLGETIAAADENVYYNVISSELDPANELTFRILASGKGLKNHFPQTSIENQLTVYDSNQEIVNADVSSNFGDYTEAELSREIKQWLPEMIIHLRWREIRIILNIANICIYEKLHLYRQYTLP